MLEPMQKDAAIEVVSTVRANIFRYKEQFGHSQQLEADRKAVLDFKDKIRFRADHMDWEEVLAFSEKWMAKYPNDLSQVGQDAA